MEETSDPATCWVHTDDQRELNPITGWPLRAIVRLDSVVPGFMRQIVRAGESRPRRQAVYFALANGVAVDPDHRFHSRATGIIDQEPRAWLWVQHDLAHLLLDLDPRDIVEAVHGQLPEGLMGALRKIGPKPLLTPADYGVLWTVFSDPAEAARRRVLLQAREITSRSLRALMATLDALICPNVLDEVTDPNRAEAFATSLMIARRFVPTATDARITKLVAGRGDQKLAAVIRRVLAESAEFGPPPFDDHPALCWLTNARMLAEAGATFNNCLAETHKLLEVLSGEHFYAVYREDDHCAVLEFQQLTLGWVFEQAYGSRNRSISTEVRDRLAAILADIGAPSIVPTQRAPEFYTLSKVIGRDRLWEEIEADFVRIG